MPFFSLSSSSFSIITTEEKDFFLDDRSLPGDEAKKFNKIILSFVRSPNHVVSINAD